MAGASDEVVAALADYAEPLGVAFQLRDDLLGAFGDPRATGKPAGSDLRAGKRTSLVLEAMPDVAASEPLERVLGKTDASDRDVRAAVAALEASGARARVEARLADLVRDARAALARAAIDDEGRRPLEGAILALTERDR
jgi:geranylgeranyl diphosphate synthase type I